MAEWQSGLHPKRAGRYRQVGTRIRRCYAQNVEGHVVALIQHRSGPDRPADVGAEGMALRRDSVEGRDAGSTVIAGRAAGSAALLDAENANHEIVAAGWAWWYRKYALGDVSARMLELHARRRGRSSSADAVPLPAWEWRKESNFRTGSGRHGSEPGNQNRSGRRSTRQRVAVPVREDEIDERRKPLPVGPDTEGIPRLESRIQARDFGV